MMNLLKQGGGFGLIVEQVVDKQIKRNYPPEAAEAYNRLIGDSFSDLEARRLISMAVQVEIFRLMRYGEAFNHARYIGNLHGLPDLPDID
ncbi:MAG: hypothetical protein CVU14_02840 [Bacteroidetes bacterium HGW-Bacteroidetes-9]|jgi:hypothetical protein|nr:MAG: hypothetical protein CVU14_02840 [Bacteroidetes bacterium HGW-Bacteroidetes-9]